MLARFIALGMLLGAVACTSEVEGNRDENFSEVGRPGSSGSSENPTPTGSSSSSGGSSSSSGGSSSGGQQTPAFSLSVSSNSMSGELYDLKSIDITVAGTNGFTGTVDLVVEGAGTNVQTKLSKTSLKAGESATLQVFSSNGGASNFSIKGTSAGAAEQTQALTFTASKVLTMHLKQGFQATPTAPDGWSAGPADFRLAPMSQFRVTNALPLSVKVVNDDTSPHIVHGNGAFTHGSTTVPIPAKGTDPLARTLTVAATLTGYEHTIGAGGSRNFSLQIVN